MSSTRSAAAARPRTVRAILLSLAASGIFTQTACQGPDPLLRQSQLHSRQLYEQNKMLAVERDRMGKTAAQVAAERERLQQQQAAMEEDLRIANQRLENLAQERAELKQRYVSALERARNQSSPLSTETTRRFEELAKKYPEFEFDPTTGVSKFHSDILFPSGSSDLQAKAAQLLKEFAAIMNQGDAKRLNILVVGHTDDKPIQKKGTAAKHPTNWHLSTNRANAVVLTLAKSGLAERRMGVAGYSMHQPVVPNSSEQARQRNRRVEIFVLAPDAVVAGWDPLHSSRN